MESLLVVKSSTPLTKEQYQHLKEALKPIAESAGMKSFVLDEGLEVGIHSDIRPLMQGMLDEQRQTNQLLALLIDAMAEAEGDEGEAEPVVYMDGSPVR